MNNPAIQIIERYKLGTCTPEEKVLVEAWFMKYGNDEEIDSNLDIERIKAEMWQTIQARREFRVKNIWPRLAVASAVLFIISVAAFYYFQPDKGKGSDPLTITQSDVSPGISGATLTLANGKQIRLHDAANGELASEAGVTISKSANGQLVYSIAGTGREDGAFNTLTTAKGETYQVRLPDGSLVYLNAASSLKYTPSLIENGKRTVQLKGEGYFEISKDLSHPFVVKSDAQEVEVLGTHFNVNTYEDEQSGRTTLLEGAVKVSVKEGGSVIIKPGEQAVINGTGLKVTQVDAGGEVAWINGDIQFDNKRIEDIMRLIARWYDVEVIYEGDRPDAKWYGSVSRARNLSQVLRMMEKSREVYFRITGRTVYVTKYQPKE
ncbi:MAG: FecR family protein [Pseudobacter sp.]|uniref:FecR family protein n=1 Tax=Pseudobacter sp. TaxID=2045420 RepID=UPI003F7FB3CE